MKNILDITTNSRKRLYVSPQVHVILEDMDVELLETSNGAGAGNTEGQGTNDPGNDFFDHAKSSSFYEPYSVDFDDDSDF